MPQIEKQQIGRYEILQEIGRGAMGVVFKGRDPLIGRAVAVKTITAGVAESADLLERFYREARAAGGLQHPNIVTIYEMAESGGAPFIAMEYLEGESLERLIARQPALSLRTRIDYVLQACRALDYAHRRGVIHRDVKPANIMVTAEGIVKVVDFGIARIADTSKTQTGMLLGTLAYMSPEQLRGQHADARCDIWALGVLLYELIAYRRPFAGENHAALLLSILQNEPPSIRQIVPECPITPESVISRALRKDDKERYATMEALLKDLENVSASPSREAFRSPVGKELPSAIGGQTLAATQSVEVQPPIRSAKIGAQPAAERPAGASPIAKSHSPQSTRPAPPAKARPMAQPPARLQGRGLAVVAIFATALVLTLGAVHYRKQLSAFANPGSRSQVELPVPNPIEPPATVASTIPISPAPPIAPATPLLPAQPSIPSIPSIEDQQRHLIDLAHEAADRQDYKTAQIRLGDATKLSGPLNGLAANLRREFSKEAHGEELRRAAHQEQALWDQAMADLQNGHLDDADKSLRDILTLPEGGQRWDDAERYLDQIIPQRRQQDQIWAEAQLQSTSTEPGHLLKEFKSLDDLLAAGGPHQEQARQMRDAVLMQMLRGNARRNRAAAPALSPGQEAQISQLKNQFNDFVQKGDAAALEPLQQLRPQFKSISEAAGPLAYDARDYLNNLIPKAQKHIEDNLAAVESNSSANAAYESAVKEFDRAVATQNTAMLRDQVLPAFRQIAQSGSVRAKEAAQYAGALVPAALKKSQQQQ